jgi:hypothetical protein
MGFTRRAFLQRAGLVLTAWGISDLVLWQAGNRYRTALAAPNSRKLALLVGINQYPGNTFLEGCVTDVELQRELLIHRFGVRSPDILTLTDQQATREAIETAFVEHLLNQAKPDDVVIFHFSGLGSTLSLRGNPGSGQKTLVTADGLVPNGEVPLVNDILDDTLWLLLRSLKTSKVTTILDTSFFYPGNLLQGNLRVRAYPNPSTAHPLPSESAFQEQLLSQMQLSREQLNRDQLTNPRSRLSFPGIVLSPEPLATETRWGRFSAGLFTYALTQSLWQSTPATTLRVNLAQVSEQVSQWVNQSLSQSSLQPFSSQAQVPFTEQKVPEDVSPTYWLKSSALGADGVITGIGEDGKTVELWLGGLPARLIETYGLNSLFTVLSPKAHQGLMGDRQSKSSSLKSSFLKGQSLKLQVIAREGLSAKAKIYADVIIPSAPVNDANSSIDQGSNRTTDKISDKASDSDPNHDAPVNSFPEKTENSVPIQLGQWIQEAVRVLPRNVGLTVALDSNLERIERVDAISAFSTVPRIFSAIAGEQPADYLFSKVQAGQITQLAALPTTTSPLTLPSSLASPPAMTDAPSTIVPKPVPGGYSLFSPGRDLLLNTTGEGGEAVKVAVRRLVPKLQTLLANKLLSLTINDKTSRLGIQVTLELLTPKTAILRQQETLRAPGVLFPEPPSSTNQSGEQLRLPLGSQIRYRIKNLSSQAFYWILLGLDTANNLISLLPPETQINLRTNSFTDSETHLTINSVANSAINSVANSSINPPITNPETDSQTDSQTKQLDNTKTTRVDWSIQGAPGQIQTYLICCRAPFSQTLTTLMAGQHSAILPPIGTPISNPLEVVQAILQDLHNASEPCEFTNQPDIFTLDVNTWVTFPFIYQVV